MEDPRPWLVGFGSREGCHRHPDRSRVWVSNPIEFLTTAGVWACLLQKPNPRADEHRLQAVRWKFGMPPVTNANDSWIQHLIRHLSPVGVAGFSMANGSMSTPTANEGELRKALIEADLVDYMVALPGQINPFDT